MTVRQLIGIGLRLLAMWLCLNAFVGYGLVLASANNRVDHGSFSPAVVEFMVVIAFELMALVLWFFSNHIAGALLSGFSKDVEIRIRPSDLVVVGCVLMGLWWLKDATLPLLSLWLRSIFLSSTTTDQSTLEMMSTSIRINCGLYLLQIAVALILIYRSRRIASWLLQYPALSSGETYEDKEPAGP